MYIYFLLYKSISKDPMGVVQTRDVLIIGKVLYRVGHYLTGSNLHSATHPEEFQNHKYQQTNS